MENLCYVKETTTYDNCPARFLTAVPAVGQCEEMI